MPTGHYWPQITEYDIKSLSVDWKHLKDGAITTAKIGDNQVTPAKLSHGTNNHVMRMSGSNPGWGLLVNANIASNANIDRSKIAYAESSANPTYPAAGNYRYGNRGSDVTGVSNGYREIMSLSLPAGVWVVAGTVVVNSGGTNIQRIVSAVSRNSDSVDGGGNDGGLSTFLNRSAAAVPEQMNLPTGLRIFGNSGTSNIYLVAYTEGTAYANQFDSNCCMWAFKIN